MSFFRKKTDVEKLKKRFNNIHTGRFTYGLENLKIYCWDNKSQLEIGKFCSIGPDVKIFLGGNHHTDWISTFPFGHAPGSEVFGKPIQDHPTSRGDIIIGNDVWIGGGAVLMSGINLGDGAVVGAQAMVTRNIQPYTIVAGNPAKQVSQRFSDDEIIFLQDIKWWDQPDNVISLIREYLCDKPTPENILRIKHILQSHNQRAV